MRTAGAFVALPDGVPFVLGPTTSGDHLAVVRLGGHVEPGETPWQCAAREALEEAGLRIAPVVPRRTYHARASEHGAVLLGADYPPHMVRDDPQPLLVIGSAMPGAPVSVMYLATTTDAPAPASEVAALALLDRAGIRTICRRPITLREFMDGGGTVRARAPLNDALPLLPFDQLRLLAEILDQDPDVLGHEPNPLSRGG